MARLPLRAFVLAAGLGLASGTAAAQEFDDCAYRSCMSRAEIGAVNAGVTGALALARGAVTGTVRSWPDAARVFGVGAAGGLGFALAKREIGKGRSTTALPLVYASASVVENVATGEHPLGRVRVGLGPADVRVRTPFASRPGPLVEVEVDPLATAALVVLPLAGYRAELNGSFLFWRSDEDYFSTSNGLASGVALGRVIVVSNEAFAETLRHEAVHALQSRQAGAVAPFGTAGSIVPSLRRTSFGGQVSWDVRTGIPALVGGLSIVVQPYNRRFIEREAAALARD